MKRSIFPAAACCLAIALPGSGWAQAPQFEIAGYSIEGNTLLPAEGLTQILAPYTGSGKSMDDVQKAATALRQSYEAAGYPIVQVFPPEQTARDKMITLKVIEGRVASVAVQGNRAFDVSNIRASLPPLQENAAPNAKEIVAAIAAANENPAKQIAVDFKAGSKPGAIDATINVTEDRPEKFILTLDNAGSHSTGIYKFSLGYQNANLFNRDHMASVMIGSALDGLNKSWSLSGGYRIPLYPQGLSLDLIASYSDSNATTPVAQGLSDMQFNGRGTLLGARLNQPLPSVGQFRHKLIYGLDYKDFKNECNIGGAANTCGTVSAIPASVTYFAQANSPLMQVNGSVALIANIPGGPNGSPDDYTAARAGAGRHWNAWRFSAAAMAPLPHDLIVRANFAAQLSRNRLVSGEQFGAGGATSVRGYSERVIAGDEGNTTSLELYSPDYGKHIGGPNDSLRALVFYDFGRVYRNDARRFSETGSESIYSYGAGLRYALGRDLSARVDVGIVRREILTAPSTGTNREKDDAFGHFALQYSF